MLGKLFNMTTGATGPGAGADASPLTGLSTVPEPVSSLDSVQEDLHTRSLLYPDFQTLFQTRYDQVSPLPGSLHLSAAAAATAFDLDGDVDLDMRDARVLIMQDTIGSIPASLLYDSQTPPTPPTPTVSDWSFTTAGLSHFSHGMQDTPRRLPPTSPRKPSLGHASRPVAIQPGSPQLRQSGTFDRRPSLHSRSQSRMETEAQRTCREYADEISVISSCVFGNSEFLAYRGTSTKVHVLPSDPRPQDLSLSSSSMLYDGRGSLGRSSLRSSKLSQSFSSESASMFPHPSTASLSSAASFRSTGRKRVLITRLFPVVLPNEEDVTRSMVPQGPSADDSAGSSANKFILPAGSAEEAAAEKKKRKGQLKQKRTPMYAIALIVSLPQPPSPPPPPALQASLYSASGNVFRGPGSYPEQESFPSSYGSGRRVGWALATAAAGGHTNGLGIDLSATGDTIVSSSPSATGVISATTDIEERMDPVTQHWDIIMRTLTQLQTVASMKILALLRAADVGSPEPQPSIVPHYTARKGSIGGRWDDSRNPMKAPKMSTKYVTLPSNALADTEQLAHEVDSARSRIAVGLRALRVVTGQNRWGIWREEARSVSRWAASVREKQTHQTHQTQHTHQPQQPQSQPQPSSQPPFQHDVSPPAGSLPLRSGGQPGQDAFLYNLLTAFLATHTDWLQALSPARYRRRHMTLHSHKGNDDSLPARTIIVSRDKIAARRIIFLLAAFLPAAQNTSAGVHVHRPSTSMSWGALSQSPPASLVVPIMKEESLRRKINRRAPGGGGGGGSGRRASHARNLSLQGLNISGEVAGPSRSASISAAGIPAPLAHLQLHRSGHHERRPSDTSSIRGVNLPFPGSDLATRKSSAATTTTITSDTTVPVPHFATAQRSESSLSALHEITVGSAAADDLKRTLQRGDSGSMGQNNPLPTTAPWNSSSGAATDDASAGPASDAGNHSIRWGSVLTGLLGGGRRRDSTVSQTGGRRHSRNASLSSWDPLSRRVVGGPPLSPGKPRSDWRPLDRPAGVDGSGTLASGAAGGFSAAVAARGSISGSSGIEQPTESAATDAHMPRAVPLDSPNIGLVGSTFARHESFRRMPDANTMVSDTEGRVIDIDVAFPDYIKSFETAVSSPSSSGFLSTPGFGSGLDAFEQAYRVSVDGDLPANVAGWLQSYHPDFCLQAIPPQGNLMAQIKESLCAEPSPLGLNVEASPQHSHHHHHQYPHHQHQPPQTGPLGERWVDISSAIVIDTAKLAITRVRYSRLMRPKLMGDAPTPRRGSDVFTPTDSPPSSTATSPEMQQLDERFVEESIVSADGTLALAMERVIAQGVAGSGTSNGAMGGADGASGATDVSSGMPAGAASAVAFDGASGCEGTTNSNTGSSTDASLRSSGPVSVHQGRRGSLALSTGLGGEAYAARPRYMNPSPTAAVPFSPLTPLGFEEVPRAECKTVLLSALENLVRDVVRQRRRADESARVAVGEGESQSDSPDEVSTGSEAAQDDVSEPSILQAAVQAWLESVDMGEV